MNKMEKQISKRLEKVASFVDQGAALLDVGSDHAYLPIYLLEAGRIPSAIAGEVVKGPYESAKSNIEKHGLASKIQVRLASGLAALEEGDQVSNLVIAGMGGRLIADILEAGLDKLPRFSKLILQPNNREDELRVWLRDHDLKIDQESILEEAGKIYEILVVSHGAMNLDPQDVRFGPHLIQEQSPVFVAKWQRELEKLEYAYGQVPAEHTAARADLENKMQDIKEVFRVSK